MDTKQQTTLRDAITAHQQASAELAALDAAYNNLTAQRRDALDRLNKVTETVQEALDAAKVGAVILGGSIYTHETDVFKGSLKVLTVESIDEPVVDPIAEPAKL